jgi:hypothetical protein
MRTLLQSLLATAFLFSATAVLADESTLLPADAPLAGVSQQDWSRRWWEWAASFDMNESPVADRTGAQCGNSQSGDVWFLAGTYGTRRTVRSCRVPQGKYLFFPLINYVVAPPADGTSVSCESITRVAARMTEGVFNLVLEIDGVRHEALEQHRLPTAQCFDLGARTPQQFRVYPAAANGYYVALKPLPPGRHVINFGGALPSTLQAVTYTLLVE